MKYLKNWKVFESVWSPEEFVSELTHRLGEYNLSVIFVRELINRYDIESEIESGKTPLQLAKEIASDLELDSRGKEGFPQIATNRPRYDVMKYL